MIMDQHSTQDLLPFILATSCYWDIVRVCKVFKGIMEMLLAKGNWKPDITAIGDFPCRWWGLLLKSPSNVRLSLWGRALLEELKCLEYTETLEMIKSTKELSIWNLDLPMATMLVLARRSDASLQIDSLQLAVLTGRMENVAKILNSEAYKERTPECKNFDDAHAIKYAFRMGWRHMVGYLVGQGCCWDIRLLLNTGESQNNTWDDMETYLSHNLRVRCLDLVFGRISQCYNIDNGCYDLDDASAKGLHVKVTQLSRTCLVPFAVDAMYKMQHVTERTTYNVSEFFDE